MQKIKSLNCIIILLFLCNLVLGQANAVENAKLYQRAKSLEQAGLRDEAMNLYDQLLSQDSENHHLQTLLL